MCDDSISAEKPELKSIHCWLECSFSGNDSSYRHLHIKENGNRDDFLDELFQYIDHAHQGARNRLRQPLGVSLHPFHKNTIYDPAFGYPQRMGDIALQGFFGEIFAGIVAEYYASTDDSKWEVPVFLFRHHNVGFQQLEYMKQTEEWGRQVVGRTGDDGLAFQRDQDGNILGWLACEAKCTQNHSATLIGDNHAKLSQSITRPIDHLRLIEALQDYKDDEYRQTWTQALIDLFWKFVKEPESVERQNLSVYVYGQSPVRSETWIPTEKPHASYQSKKKLTSAEFFLEDVSNFINSLYSRMESRS